MNEQTLEAPDCGTITEKELAEQLQDKIETNLDNKSFVFECVTESDAKDDFIIDMFIALNEYEENFKAYCDSSDEFNSDIKEIMRDFREQEVIKATKRMM
jgi:hypothetical protein